MEGFRISQAAQNIGLEPQDIGPLDLYSVSLAGFRVASRQVLG